MKKNIPLKKRQGYHGFLKKYHNVYLFIAILVGCGILDVYKRQQEGSDNV